MRSSQACVYSQLYVLEKVGGYSIYRWENVEWRNNREQKKKKKHKHHIEKKKKNTREIRKGIRGRRTLKQYFMQVYIIDGQWERPKDSLYTPAQINLLSCHREDPSV